MLECNWSYFMSHNISLPPRNGSVIQRNPMEIDGRRRINRATSRDKFPRRQRRTRHSSWLVRTRTGAECEQSRPALGP